MTTRDGEKSVESAQDRGSAGSPGGKVEGTATGVAAARSGRVSSLPRSHLAALQRMTGNRALGALMRAGTDTAGALSRRPADAKVPLDPVAARLVADEIAKLFPGGAGTTAAAAEEASVAVGGAGVITIAGVTLTIVAAVGGFILYYAEDARRAGQRYQQQAQRAAIAQNLREMGLITEEEATDFVLTGHLFIPKVARWAMTKDGRWLLLDVTKLDVAASKLGYQVYILKAADGRVLYIGRSGGADGRRPDNWTDRVRAHIDDTSKSDWIGAVDTIIVYADLTLAESMALEEDLIREHPGSDNERSGDFSARAPEGDLGGSVHSAIRRPPLRFKTEIVPFRGVPRPPASKPGKNAK